MLPSLRLNLRHPTTILVALSMYPWPEGLRIILRDSSIILKGDTLMQLSCIIIQTVETETVAPFTNPNRHQLKPHLKASRL